MPSRRRHNSHISCADLDTNLKRVSSSLMMDTSDSSQQAGNTSWRQPASHRRRRHDRHHHVPASTSPAQQNNNQLLQKRGKTKFRDDRSRKLQNYRNRCLSRHTPNPRENQLHASTAAAAPSEPSFNRTAPAFDDVKSDNRRFLQAVSSHIPVDGVVMLNLIDDNNMDQEMAEPDASREEAPQESQAGMPVAVAAGAERPHLRATLTEYLQVEDKFQPHLALQAIPQRGEVSVGVRDGAAHVLRYLKVWYELPSGVLAHAINLLDRFLTKMKVQPSHMSCISVSCMSIAIDSHKPQLPPINTEELVKISQCACTVGDISRMCVVIEQKLGAVGGSVVTALQWLYLFGELLLPLVPPGPGLAPEQLAHKLEILLCDASTCSLRASELALVLICTQIDAHINNQTNTAWMSPLIDSVMELKKICQISDDAFCSSQKAVVEVLKSYNNRQKNPYRQRLIWKLSTRTLKLLRPTDRLTSMLPTIQEQHLQQQQMQQQEQDSDSEHADWPTSHMLPVVQ